MNARFTQVTRLITYSLCDLTQTSLRTLHNAASVAPGPQNKPSMDAKIQNEVPGRPAWVGSSAPLITGNYDDVTLVIRLPFTLDGASGSWTPEGWRSYICDGC